MPPAWNDIDPAFQPVSASFALEVTTLHHRVDEFLDKKRVALRTLNDIPAQRIQ